MPNVLTFSRNAQICLNLLFILFFSGKRGVSWTRANTTTRSRPHGVCVKRKQAGLLLHYFLHLKDIHHLGIGATNANTVAVIARQLTSITQYIDIGKSHMNGHRAQLSTLRIEVPRVAYRVSAMASVRPFPVNQGNFDFRFSHCSFCFCTFSNRRRASIIRPNAPSSNSMAQNPDHGYKHSASP